MSWSNKEIIEPIDALKHKHSWQENHNLMSTVKQLQFLAMPYRFLLTYINLDYKIISGSQKVVLGDNHIYMTTTVTLLDPNSRSDIIIPTKE